MILRGHPGARFYARTFAIDMAPVRQRFLHHVPAHKRILDFSCDSNYDSSHFRKLDYSFDTRPRSPRRRLGARPRG